MGAYLFDLEEVGQGGLSLGLLLGQGDSGRKVVDEGAVGVEDDGLAEVSNEDVAKLFVLVPVADAVRQREPKHVVVVEYLLALVEQGRYLGLAQNRRRRLLERLLVVLQIVSIST